jgi:transposase-like protein
MSDTVIRRAASALSPDQPIKTLAALGSGRRSTAKSWATGRRRPSVANLKILLEWLKERRAVLYQLIPELEYLITLREREPRHARGFMVRDPATGVDRRNRLGRPKKKSLEWCMPRTCTICRHPKRPDIEADLRAGMSYRDVARRHDISQHALWRHRTHVSQHTATALATITKAMGLLHQAETAATFNTTLVTVREARHCLEELLTQLNLGIER